MKIKNQNPSFVEMMSKQQLSGLNEYLCKRYGVPSGTRISYRTLNSELRGGVYWVDLRAEWQGIPFDFNVKFLNKHAELTVGEGYGLKKDARIVRIA